MIRIKTEGVRVRTKIDANTKVFELLITIGKLYEILMQNEVPKETIDEELNKIIKLRGVNTNVDSL